MQALVTLRRFRNLATIIPVLFLAAACSQGDGPESIANEPATPLPPTEPGFCDPINFEVECSDPEIVNFNGGATISVDNPDPTGINTSDRVAQMQKFPDEVFGGTLLNLDEAVDFSEGESYTVKVWSPRPVTVSFKLEEQGNPAGGLTVDEDHSGSGAWEELCFDFTGQAVPPPVVALTIIFDNGTLGQADTDPANWTFYYDDITQVQSCESAVGPGDIQPDAALYAGDAAPDLVIPDDYAERTAFGFGSVINEDYADDETFSPVLSVFSGTGYGANVAQIGFIGFPEGFLTRYETVDFKVKGVPGFVIFVELFDGGDAFRLNLTSSAYSSELSDGWFQVSIPVADFAGVDQATGIVLESDDSSQTEFRMLLNDVGFSGTGTFVPADPGIIPDVSLYDRDGTADLVIPDDFAEITVFGSGAVIDDDFTGDLDFSPALAVTTGFGYDIWNAQLAYTGFDAGFASFYETLDFKAKGLDNDVIRLRFLDGGDYLDIVLTGSPLSTDLGNGWYQVSVPLTSLTGVDAATGLLFETDNSAPSSFTFLLTDFGFSGSTGVANSPDSIIPDNVIFATDPTVSADFEFGVDYTGFEPFGSGSVFNDSFADDPDFSPVFAVTSGAGYGANVGQFAIVGFDAGFAAGFATLDFKVKGMPDDLIRVKFLDNGDYLDINLTTSEDSTALGNGWYQVSIPLSRFTGVDTATALLFESTNTSPDQFTFLLTDFGFSGTAGSGGGGTGDIAANGGFETGTFEGWEQLEGGGTQAITTDNPSSGTYAASLSIPVRGPGDPGVDNLIKNANLEAGNLTPGATVTVSFDMRGTLAGAGGVVFAELFSELSGGGTSNSEILGGGPLAPTVDWANYSFDTTLGPDVSGGVTLQLKVGCGGVEGCGADIYFDNVSIVVGDPGGTGADPGTVPDVVIYSSSAAPDLEFGVDYTGFEAFGSGSTFDNEVTSDPDFSPVFGVTTGDGYGVQVGQFAIVGFDAGFAATYETLDFKAKGLNNDIIRVRFLDAGDYLDIVLTGSPFSTDLGNGWYQVSIPLTSFTGVDTATGLLFETDSTAVDPFTFLLTDIGFSGAADGGSDGGSADNIAVNGGFETGTFAGWEQVPTDGTQVIVTDNPASGVYAANLVVPVRGQSDPGLDNVIKNANLEAGNLTPGAAVTVSFDMRGTLSGAGGVVFAELFSELSGGGTSKAELLGGGPLTPTADWVTYSFDTTLGPDVSGGVTLQLKASCGAVEGCGVDVFFDNVSIVVGGTDGNGGTGGADPGTVPDVVIYSSSAPPDLEFGVDYTGYEPFGSGSTFDSNVTSDPDFSPVFGVTTGDGYGAQVGQFAIVGFDAGFASTYETLDFKAKGLNNDIIRVRFLDAGDYLDIVLTGSPFSTDLGNGWYQVSIPLTSFTGVDTATGLLFETDDTAANPFTFLLTDIGFSGSTGPADSPDSIVPEDVIFATDPTVPAEFEFGVDYTGYEAFGSGSVFNSTFADDPDFSPVFAVTSGTGYGAKVGQFGIVGFTAGFASVYET